VLTGRRRERRSKRSPARSAIRRHRSCPARRSDRAGRGAPDRRFIASEIGRLDILLNNAGININDRHWDKLTPENAS
jgi:NAD(P)-dependent dehydrogenase (short-subunit alcohol dehydrogenase family)